MKDGSDSKKRDLLRAIKEVREKNSSLLDQARELIGSGQRIEDTAEVESEFIAAVPSDDLFPDAFWDQRTKQWQEVGSGLDMDGVVDAATQVGLYANMSTTTTSGFLDHPPYQYQPAKSVRMAHEASVHKLGSSVSVEKLFTQTENRIQVLCLDWPEKGHTRPSDLLAGARRAFEVPVSQAGDPAAVLIPVRECLQSLVARLIKCRPVQSKTRSMRAKVTAIVNDVGTSLSPKIVDSLVVDIEQVVDSLSGAKANAMSRDRVRLNLIQALSVISTLLACIDGSKLRIPS